MQTYHVSIIVLQLYLSKLFEFRIVNEIKFDWNVLKIDVPVCVKLFVLCIRLFLKSMHF